MKIIPLNAAPNQRLRVTLDGREWELTIKAARRVMCCDIRCDDRVIVQGMRIVPGQPLIPYRHLTHGGNFAPLTEGDELPWWELFEKTQTLIYWGSDD